MREVMTQEMLGAMAELKAAGFKVTAYSVHTFSVALENGVMTAFYSKTYAREDVQFAGCLVLTSEVDNFLDKFEEKKGDNHYGFDGEHVINNDLSAAEVVATASTLLPEYQKRYDDVVKRYINPFLLM